MSKREIQKLENKVITVTHLGLPWSCLAHADILTTSPNSCQTHTISEHPRDYKYDSEVRYTCVKILNCSTNE